MPNLDRSNWKPIEGSRATRYLLIMVVSLAITVSVTRLYLELTGYPQLGNDTFHIAHALWGGLLLAVSTTLMLIYLNRWVFFLSAALTGIGLGLFVDEIGKFITQTNDYFFPLAAPLIYITVLLVVMLYLFIRREDAYDARGNMYIALDNMKPLLDQHIDQQDYDDLREQLTRLAQQTERSEIARMAQALLDALPTGSESLPLAKPGVIDSLVARGKQIEASYFRQTFIRRILMFFFAIVGVGAVIEIVTLGLIILNPVQLQDFIISDILIDNPLVTSSYSLFWYLGLMIVSVIVGVLLFVAFLAFLRHRDTMGTRLATVGLVISLTLGNTMSFYFNQFSVMMTSLGLFIVLLAVIRYRDRFLQKG